MVSLLDKLKDYLEAALELPVYVTMPEPRPDEFVLIDPVGGASDGDTRRPQFALQTWATSYTQAHDNCLTVMDAMSQNHQATIFADAIPLGADSSHVWWQVTYQMNALWG